MAMSAGASLNICPGFPLQSFGRKIFTDAVTLQPKGFAVQSGSSSAVAHYKQGVNGLRCYGWQNVVCEINLK